MINTKKIGALGFAMAALMSMAQAPAMADDAKSMVTNVALMPVKAASIATGLVVGVPVAIMRKSSNRTIEYTGNFGDKIGGKDHMVPMMFGSVMGLPAGVIVGTGEGVFYSGKNAFSHSVEKPFCLASMSLDKDLD